MSRRNPDLLGLWYSFSLHILILVICIWGLPDLWRRKLPEVTVISVELIPISSLTNVPTRKMNAPTKPVKEEKKPPKPVPPKAKPQLRPTPEKAPEKMPEKKPEPKAEPLPEPKAKPKPEKKPEEAKEKPKKKEEDLNYDALLKTLEEAVDADEEKADLSEEKDKVKSNSTTDFDSDRPLSMTLQDSIRSQLAKCWTVIGGGRSVGDMNVVLRIQLERDGAVANVKVHKTNSQLAGEAYYQIFVENAQRAVHDCSPLKGLPVEEYRAWKEIEFNFDPSAMLR
jgi:outer membrane biosynthesis protein TonB